MWFKLAGATFTNNLGTMESISKSYVMDYSGLTGLQAAPGSVSYADDATPDATITFTVKSGYVFKSGSTVTASGGASKTYTASADIAAGSSFTMALTGINNKVTFTGAAELVSGGGNTGGGGSEGGGEPTDPTPDVPSTGTLPLVQYALSVVSGENFYQVGFTNKTRMSTSSITDATGIWVDAGATITLTGTSGLRFDYVYATKPGPNSNDKTVNTIGGVGTASNFVSSNFFPLNADGSSNTISFTNENGTGYYYFFAIAGPNKSEEILVANYQGKITYTITSASNTPSDDVISSGTLFLQNKALSVVDGENYYVGSTNTKRMSTSSTTEATGILVPNGKTITLTGTSGLRFDYVYATSAGPNSDDKTVNTIGGVGTASNFVSSNYFPLNADGSLNTIAITNNYGQDYYYHFAIAGPNKTEVLTPSDYNITYVVS